MTLLLTAFLKSLHGRTKEEALTQLLSHLPLLNPGNSEARAEYMRLLPKVLLGSSEEMDYQDLCRQLLSLALLHPAFPHENREALTFWLSQLDSKHKGMAEINTPALSPSSVNPFFFPSPQQQTAATSQQPPALPPRIRQVHTSKDTSVPPGNSRIYLDGELSHSSHPHQQHHDHLPSLDPYSADDEEVQWTLHSCTPGQAAHFECSSPMPHSFEEGGGAGMVKEKANTVPRVSGGASAGLMEDTCVAISLNKDPGMRGKPTSSSWWAKQ